jgi:hypothetical protein
MLFNGEKDTQGEVNLESLLTGLLLDNLLKRTLCSSFIKPTHFKYETARNATLLSEKPLTSFLILQLEEHCGTTMI